MKVKALIDLIDKLYVEYQSPNLVAQALAILNIARKSEEVTSLLIFKEKFLKPQTQSKNINNIDEELFRKFLKIVLIGLFSTEQATKTLFVQLQDKLAEHDEQIKVKIQQSLSGSECDLAFRLLKSHGLVEKFPNVFNESNQKNTDLTETIIRLAWHECLEIFRNIKFSHESIKDFAKFYTALYEKRLTLSKDILEQISDIKCSGEERSAIDNFFDKPVLDIAFSFKQTSDMKSSFNELFTDICQANFKLEKGYILNKEFIKALNILVYNFDDARKKDVLEKFGVKLLAECQDNRMDIAVILRLLSCMVSLDDENSVADLEGLVNKVKNSPEKIALLHKVLIVLFKSIAKLNAHKDDEASCFNKYKTIGFVYSCCHEYPRYIMPAEILTAITANIDCIDKLYLSLGNLTKAFLLIRNADSFNPSTRKFLGEAFMPWMLKHPHQIGTVIDSINGLRVITEKKFLDFNFDERYFWQNHLLCGLRLIYVSLSLEHNSILQVDIEQQLSTDSNCRIKDPRNFIIESLKEIKHPFSYYLQYMIYSGNVWSGPDFSKSPEILKELREKIPVNSLWDQLLTSLEKQQQQKKLFSYTQSRKLVDTFIVFKNKSTTVNNSEIENNTFYPNP